MCMFCASIPAAAALGAKLNADQLGRPEEKRRPIAKITGFFIALLALASLIYHTLRWQA
jgi:hypothetical protein